MKAKLDDINIALRHSGSEETQLYSFFDLGATCGCVSAPLLDHLTQYPLYTSLGGPEGAENLAHTKTRTANVETFAGHCMSYAILVQYYITTVFKRAANEPLSKPEVRVPRQCMKAPFEFSD